MRQLPDADGALNLLERFTASAPAEVIAYLGAHHAALHYLLAAFSYSAFLAETLLREPQRIVRLHQDPSLYRLKSGEEILAVFEGAGGITGLRPAEAAAWLARAKRHEYVRIMLRDVLELATLSEVTLELSALADALLESALEQAQTELSARYGAPSSPFAVLSLGKLGGNELNYSSDIDLLFLYRAAGDTTNGITHKEYFVQLAGRITGLLTMSTPHGSVFRVDMRLRPQGGEGEAAHSLAQALDYYRQRARDWELQALVKARHSAGDAALAREFLQEVQPLVYQTIAVSGDAALPALASVLRARQEMSKELRRRRSRAIDVKIGRGGIRDIEFLCQCLQRLYGGQDPWLRSGSTLFALQKLADKGWLNARDHATLSRAYHFLRLVEHRLQLDRDQQVHRLPERAAALDLLARRAGVRGDGRTLLAELAKAMNQVAEIYERVLGGARHGAAPAPTAFALAAPAPPAPGEQEYPRLLRFLETRAPALHFRLDLLTGSQAIQRGRRNLERFLANVTARPSALDTLAAQPALIDRAAEILEHSPYLAELLIRSPEDVEALGDLDVSPAPAGHRFSAGLPLEHTEPVPAPDDPLFGHLAASEVPLTEKMAGLRRHYRRRLLRIQARSLLAAAPVFETLEATTYLAEQVIRAALCAADPAGAPGMAVIALGRLGVRESDVGSDADLAFFLTASGLQPADPEQRVLAIRVIERLIAVLASHTSDGQIFAVDSRLRPRGREGELVESARYVEQYFSEQADPWEAISYMKSKAIAGDLAGGTDLLERVQRVIGARFGAGSDASRALAGMRRRLETATAGASGLKSAPGGYYDIDFVLTYLRLRRAGVFYPSLNTLERLAVVEKAGQLTAAQATTLREGAIVLRAVQHAQRLETGRGDADLPLSGPGAAPFARLAERWFPEHLRGRPLSETLEGVMARVRGVFLEVFAGA